MGMRRTPETVAKVLIEPNLKNDLPSLLPSSLP